MRNKGGIVDALRQITFIARQHQHMVEVEIAGLQHTHDLYAHGRFAVERN